MIEPLPQTDTAPPSLLRRVPPEGLHDPDAILELFLDWVTELGFELFGAQEEALLELMAGRHVVLNTPTGSGKSLVATLLQFRAVCERRTCWYTSPIKALASEKFFAACRDLGAANVGMLTGDASINPQASVVCCTAEVLANLALRRGEGLEADYVVMDEFHYYADPERGVAWQVPLLTLPRTQFLLMSATLGNPAPISERLERRTGREVATVIGHDRPVPLSYEYRESPIQDTVEELASTGRAPVYIVHFTQRECAERAQALTSLKLTAPEDKARIREAIGDFRFDTPYGKEMRRFLGFGLGVHHAGLLPKYRLLVEQLAQQGLLRAICGTDTLGVGVNMPVRTVLFDKLCKYDGRKMTILAVRDFQQIAGRAGRKGFDTEGLVACQAPEWVSENKRLDEKLRSDPKRAKKTPRKRPPTQGYVHWDRDTFERLIRSPPETLESRFRLSYGTVLQLIQRDAERNDPDRNNFDSLRQVLRDCHEDDNAKRKLLQDAALLVRSLHRAGILRLQRDTSSAYYWVSVAEELQIDFSLHRTLSLYLVETLAVLDPTSPEYVLDVLSVVEAILENPDTILRRQADVAKDQLVAQMKAEGVEYEERMRRLEEVTWPKPNAELLYETFRVFRGHHPWVSDDNVRPKGIGREIYAEYMAFDDFVRRYGLQRSEGLVLRYLSQLYKTLAQNVPDERKTPEVWDLLGFLRTLLSRVDTSLIDEWEGLLDPKRGLSRLAGTTAGEQELRTLELLSDPKAFAARIRAELYQLVRALARRDFEEAALCVREVAPEEDPAARFPRFDADRFTAVMAPYFDQFGDLVFTPEARATNLTRIELAAPGRWEIEHTLVDPERDNLWRIAAEVWLDPDSVAEAAAAGELDRPLLRLVEIGP
jgi:superfamily II RNA helicase